MCLLSGGVRQRGTYNKESLCYEPIIIYNSVKTHLEKLQDVDKP